MGSEMGVSREHKKFQRSDRGEEGKMKGRWREDESFEWKASFPLVVELFLTSKLHPEQTDPSTSSLFFLPLALLFHVRERERGFLGHQALWI